MSYNGYPNWETWNFQLYEEEYITEFVKKHKNISTYKIAEYLKDSYDDYMLEAQNVLPSFLMELLECSFQQVDFYYLVEHNMEETDSEELDEEEEEEEEDE